MIIFKPQSIRYLDEQGGHYSRNLKAIKREKLTRPRDIALQLAHRDAVIDVAVNWIKSAIALNKAKGDSDEAIAALEGLLLKLEGDMLR